MLFDNNYNYELITEDFYDLKYFSVKNIGNRIKRRIITFYDLNGEVIYSRKSINRTVLSNDVNLKDAKVITKYYLEEMEGDDFDSHYKNIRYFHVLNLGYYRSYESCKTECKNNNEEIQLLFNEYDEGYKEIKLDEDEFLKSKKSF